MQAAGLEARPAVLEKGFNSHYWGRSVTFQAVSRWLRGEAIPSQDKLQALAEWLNVEPQFLRYGERVAQMVAARQKRWEEGAGFLEREVFDAFLSLSATDKKIVREVILAFAKKPDVTK